MAASPYVWGIDIGKCSLKALRCRLSPTDPRKLVAEACDVIEYPMMLSQAAADRVELVRSALAEFVGRNELTGDRVAVAAPGQAGLAKFIKLPPVDAKKIPNIVKYEASQQIPFPLDQVVWDWQRLATGLEEGGFVMDAEVALFAMKREQVDKAITPFEDAGIDVDIIQMSPIAVANMAIFDQLPDPATIDPENPPASLVLVSIGVDTTDLVVTNGLRVWQRSMPIGGSTFTKALVQDLKLTFIAAENEKRNAVRASDPRAVFKAMRPVFNQFVAELQRSLNYVTGTDRSAKIGKVLLLGNAAKLRGLTDFVGKQLQLEVQRLDKFASLDGPALAVPAFRENRLGFATAYGLALQAAGAASLKTSLLPREKARDRLIDAKRPWVVAALVALLAAGAINFAGWFASAASYDPTKYRDAFAASDAAKSRSGAAKAGVEAAEQRLRDTVASERYLVDVHDRRFQSLDLLRAIETILPRDEPGAAPDSPAERNEIRIDSFDMEFFPDLATWFNHVERDWDRTLAAAGKSPDGSLPGQNAPAEEAPPDSAAPPPVGDVPPPLGDQQAVAGGPDPTKGPKGPGWVIQIIGHHFHNEDRHAPMEGEQFVLETLVRGLLGDGGKVTVTAGIKAGQQVPVAELGIGYPVIVKRTPVTKVKVSTAREVAGGGDLSGRPPEANAEEEKFLQLKQYAFVLQFAWQPASPGSPRRTAAQPASPADAGFTP